MTRQGDNHVVAEAAPDTRIDVLREELVIVNDRRDPHQILLVLV